MIPRIFHFIFGLQTKPQQLHLIHYLCLQSCFAVNRPEKVFFYCHREPVGRYWSLIKHRLEIVFVELAPEVLACNYGDRFIADNFLYAHHSDFLRVECLNRHGGVYADLDTLFVNEMPEYLYQKPFVLGVEPPVLDRSTGEFFPSICNAVMMSEKGSEFGRRLRESMPQALDGTWSNHSCLLAYRLSREMPEDLHVEPERSFYKHRSTPDGINTLLLGCDTDMHGVYSMHLWAHLWWSRWRRDFSKFHAGKMTESFIRSADTTYTLAARRFLPPVEKRFFGFAKTRPSLERQQPVMNATCWSPNDANNANRSADK